MDALLEVPKSLATAGSVRAATEGNVMVVDDNPANLKLMEEILRPLGYEVKSFPRGRMALNAAGKMPPDLILLDINMPEMNGYEVCEQLKSSPALRQVPVIFLSALNALEDRLRGFRSGSVDFVSKPFQIEEVQARVETHVKLSRLKRKIENDNDRLQELVQAQVRKIADAQMETIFAIAKLAESRDDETGRHIERVQTFCGLLATAMREHGKFGTQVERDWISLIIHASPLHDIGKVAIPDRILLKPGRLTPEEFDIMKTHSELGAQTLRTVHNRYPDNEFIRVGIDIAQSHHERWNGTGYPDGLAGEEIPLCARVLAVADVYDALRSKRCYKAAMTHDEACAVILGESGKHFDPDITAVFSGVAGTYADVWEGARCLSDVCENSSLSALESVVGPRVPGSVWP